MTLVFDVFVVSEAILSPCHPNAHFGVGKQKLDIRVVELGRSTSKNMDADVNVIGWRVARWSRMIVDEELYKFHENSKHDPTPGCLPEKIVFLPLNPVWYGLSLTTD